MAGEHPVHRSNSNVVMVVEDNVDVRSVLVEALTEVGYQVEQASNGLDALMLLRERPRPQVILLDLMMPVMDGWRFREEQCRDPSIAFIPTIAITASDAPPTIPAVTAVLRKPFDLDRVLEKIGDLLPPPRLAN